MSPKSPEIMASAPITRRCCLLLFLAIMAGVGLPAAAGRSEEAYATLLYGDEFLLGVRVLGKSIRDTGSSKDMVALVSDGVSHSAKKLLQADGWIVEPITLLANPNQVRPKRFWGVYTKLKIFNMTSYRKVVYLDADTVVVKSIEDLFKCGRFCANLKHSERMNSGVMVVEPSETVFNDMMKKINLLPSYTGGDQGFLNSYFKDFANAHLFEPDIPYDVVKSKPLPEMQRLSTLYNADVGLYMLANKWMVDEKELRVIHYTLGPLKPWDWWTAWLLKPVDVWQDVRVQLEESLPGTGGGRNPNEQLIVKFLFSLPICILLFCYYQSYSQVNRGLMNGFLRGSICDYARRMYYRYRSGGGLPVYTSVGVASSSIANSNQQFPNSAHSKVPSWLGPLSIFVCFMCAAFSLALAFIVIPHQVMPWTGLLLMYEWTFTLFFILFGSFLRLSYNRGKVAAYQAGTISSDPHSSEYDSWKGHQLHTSNCDISELFYLQGMACLAIIAPSLPCMFGITALFARLGLMVGGGIVLASFMTYASEHLSIRAFAKGLEDYRDQTRTRNICLLF